MIPEKNDEFVVHYLNQDGLNYSVLPNWGFIDRIELRPVNDSLNVDAQKKYRFGWKLLGPDGQEIHCEAKLISRGIKS